MFPGILFNKTKIGQNGYTKEQSRTKKYFAPAICVFAYLSPSQRNHSLKEGPAQGLGMLPTWPAPHHRRCYAPKDLEKAITNSSYYLSKDGPEPKTITG